MRNTLAELQNWKRIIVKTRVSTAKVICGVMRNTLAKLQNWKRIIVKTRVSTAKVICGVMRNTLAELKKEIKIKMDVVVSPAPHIAGKFTTRSIMLDVLIALAPLLIMAIVYFGYLALLNVVVCMLACFGFELLYSLIISKKWNISGVKSSSVWDCSCLVTGAILALNLPPYMKIWGLNVMGQGGVVLFSFDTVIACVVASAFAIVVVKMLFGGIGKNFVNPALMGRIFLFICFGISAVSTLNTLPLDLTTGATWLGGIGGKKEIVDGAMLLNMFIGNKGSAAVGEVCGIAVIIGAIYLTIRKVIDPKTPLIIIVSTFLFALLFEGVKNGLGGMELFNASLAHVLTGGLLFGAVFMATDYSTSPNTTIGNIVFAVGIALITMLIRIFSPMPEGVSFAIVIMNIFVPLIDKLIVPRPFGKVKTAKIKEGKKQ